jgi:Rrf2 family protein
LYCIDKAADKASSPSPPKRTDPWGVGPNQPDLAGFVMLLTRRACYGLIAAKHLAEHASEGSFSANDLAEFYRLPHEALAKILQRLATAGLLRSHHGMKGGYTLARGPRAVSVFDVIKASEGSRSDIQGEHWRHMQSVLGYHPLGMVIYLVEDRLRELTIADINEEASSPTAGETHVVSSATAANAKRMA